VFVVATTLNETTYLQKIKVWNAADSNVTGSLLNSTKKFENGSIDSKILVLELKTDKINIDTVITEMKTTNPPTKIWSSP